MSLCNYPDQAHKRCGSRVYGCMDACMHAWIDCQLDCTRGLMQRQVCLTGTHTLHPCTAAWPHADAHIPGGAYHIHAPSHTCMHPVTHACTQSHMYAPSHTCMHPCTHACIQSHMHAPRYTCMHPVTCSRIPSNVPAPAPQTSPSPACGQQAWRAAAPWAA